MAREDDPEHRSTRVLGAGLSAVVPRREAPGTKGEGPALQESTL